MIRFILIISAFLYSLTAYNQIVDDFTDGDFTNNPSWNGDITHFEVNTTEQLHLKSTGTDTSCLSISSNYATNCEWKFWVKLSFQTSANNNARVYLCSDQDNLASSLNGYFVQVGESNDSIALYKQTGAIIEKLIAGTIAYTNNSVNTIRIKVVRKQNGDWQLFSDPTGGINFLLEGTASDLTYTTSSYFGIYCKYTSSNATKFYFDDFSIGEIIVDTIAPKINCIKVLSPTELSIIFSESIDKTAAETNSNYSISPIIGNPILSILDTLNTNMVKLKLPSELKDSNIYQLSINGMKDISGNMSTLLIDTFAYYIPKSFDIVINEIMADPSPTNGLPEYEYIELYNRSNFDISLENWVLTIGASNKTFTNLVIPSHKYLIVCSTTASPEFVGFGTVYDFSSFTITNAGQLIMLRDDSQRIISNVLFNESWYQSSEKAEGGWSLEQIDPFSPCLEEKNWNASNATIGGTPGAINSVNSSNADHVAPEILRASIDDYFSIFLFFNERIDSAKMKNANMYFVDNGIGKPTSVELISPDYKKVRLLFSTIIQNNIIYTLSVSDSIQDCSGNYISGVKSARFAIPQPVLPKDIVINEIMFNPKDESVDFVELYNNSNKVIDLAELDLCNLADDSLTSTKVSVSDGFLLFPNEFVVLSANSESIQMLYTTGLKQTFVEMTTLPTYNVDNGTVVLKNKTDETIDIVRYNESMHYPLLLSTKGVSLERINYNLSSSDSSNWHSASELVGYSTPGYKNSQYSEIKASTNGSIELYPELFSPDNDGINDVLMINYNFNSPDYNTTITIYDANGRLVRLLVKNQLSGIKGTYTWDGLDEFKQVPPQGIYIVLFESFNTKGETVKIKKTTVIALKK
ncbi:MAG: lamin tail domain-containing protein [Bacteroidota bacterium]